MAIELDHSFAVPVPPDQAWDVLLDVARVAPCMPGATVDEVAGDVVTGKIKVKVGPIALTYAGKATFTERDPATHAVRMEAAGKETRGAGTASATVRASLEDSGGQTRVRVHTSLNVTGRPAQFGRGVMAEVGGRLIEKFSANLAQQLASGQAEPSQAAAGAAEQDADAPASDAPAPDASPAYPPTSDAPAPDTSPAYPPTSDAPAAGTATEAARVAAEGTEAAPKGAGAAADARLAIPLQELNLPVRSYNCLKSEGIDTVGQLVDRTPAELLAIRNIGDRSVQEIESKLSDLGLTLAGGPAQAVADGGAVAEPSSTLGQDRASWDGGVPAPASAPAGAGPVGGAGEGPDDAIDLLDVAAGPILKRALPALAAVVVLVVLGAWVRRRLRAG